MASSKWPRFWLVAEINSEASWGGFDSYVSFAPILWRSSEGEIDKIVESIREFKSDSSSSDDSDGCEKTWDLEVIKQSASYTYLFHCAEQSGEESNRLYAWYSGEYIETLEASRKKCQSSQELAEEFSSALEGYCYGGFKAAKLEGIIVPVVKLVEEEPAEISMPGLSNILEVVLKGQA